MQAEFESSKKELISKERIIKHPLLTNMILSISVYFLEGEYVSTMFLSLHRTVNICVKPNQRKSSIALSQGVAIYIYIATPQIYIYIFVDLRQKLTVKILELTFLFRVFFR
jgi:hypothetical protein